MSKKRGPAKGASVIGAITVSENEYVKGVVGNKGIDGAKNVNGRQVTKHFFKVGQKAVRELASPPSQIGTCSASNQITLGQYTFR